MWSVIYFKNGLINTYMVTSNPQGYDIIKDNLSLKEAHIFCKVLNTFKRKI